MSARERKLLSRRNFLKGMLAGAAGTLTLVRFGDLWAGAARGGGGPATGPGEGRGRGDVWYGFAVDLTRCIGCGACVRACKAENSVPDHFFRTWVERYTFTRDGKVHVDSPDGALSGFPADPPIPAERVEKSFFVPKLCNHCEEAPCVQVCPVGASFTSPEGVVLVDKEHCVGCGYCVQACPYAARFIHPEGGYADKCTFCYHRVTRGLEPACVEACPVGARTFGNLRDPNGKLRRLLGRNRHGVLKADLGTHPKCFYIGLDQEVL